MPWSPRQHPEDDEDGGSPPRRLPEVLDQVLAGLGAPSVDVVVTVTDRWPEVVGSEVAPHARPVSIEHGRLTVSVDSPAWATHVRWAEAELLLRLSAMVGPGVVDRVVTRVARR